MKYEDIITAHEAARFSGGALQFDGTGDIPAGFDPLDPVPYEHELRDTLDEIGQAMREERPPMARHGAAWAIAALGAAAIAVAIMVRVITTMR